MKPQKKIEISGDNSMKFSIFTLNKINEKITTYEGKDTEGNQVKLELDFVKNYFYIYGPPNGRKRKVIRLKLNR